MKSLLMSALSLVAAGVLVGAGVRTAEWALPQPAMRVIVCTYDDFKVEACVSAVELIEKARKP